MCVCVCVCVCVFYVLSLYLSLSLSLSTEGQRFQELGVGGCIRVHSLHLFSPVFPRALGTEYEGVSTSRWFFHSVKYHAPEFAASHAIIFSVSLVGQIKTLEKTLISRWQLQALTGRSVSFLIQTVQECGTRIAAGFFRKAYILTTELSFGASLCSWQMLEA